MKELTIKITEQQGEIIIVHKNNGFKKPQIKKTIAELKNLMLLNIKTKQHEWIHSKTKPDLFKRYER